MILEVVAERTPPKTACPSEIARRLSPEGWRAKMDAVREAIAKLADEGRVEVLQKGRVVDARSARGPIRVRLVRPTRSGAPARRG